MKIGKKDGTGGLYELMLVYIRAQHESCPVCQKAQTGQSKITIRL